MKQKIAANIKSGFFISLIAMPLCLGISIASSCPPIAGVITAIVGGLIVSLLGGCNLSIKGPAAGLIVIVLATVTELGAGDAILGYRRMLAVAVVAALIQIIFSLLKFGKYGRLMPPSVVHGMLAAIGIIIMAKQIHILVGAVPHGKSSLELIFEIPDSFAAINPELAFIGMFTLCLLIFLPFVPSRHIKSIPPALFALLIVVPLGLFWHLGNEHVYQFLDYDFSVGPQFLVNIPDNLFSSIVFPDFSILTELRAYKFVVMLSLVGSIESVLTVIAVDSMTKVKSDLDRDLLAVGTGNLLSALLGGLPMISEVVRSRANIDSGATDRSSNFFHGAFLLIFVTMLAPVIKEIPLAALAAMLMVTGFRLASPRQFIHVRRVGLDQFLLFTTTLVITLATDLLIGILMGCLLKVILHMSRGVKPNQLFRMTIQERSEYRGTCFIVTGPAIFTNFQTLQKRILAARAKDHRVIIDVSNASLIDHTTLSCLNNLKTESGNSNLRIVGLENLTPSSSHQLATHRVCERA